jgi:hypothetical protein
MLDDLDTDCPKCGGKVRFSLDDLVRERNVRCSRGHAVTLKDEGGGAAKTSKSLRDLDTSIERLNRTINIKL